MSSPLDAMYSLARLNGLQTGSARPHDVNGFLQKLGITGHHAEGRVIKRRKR